MGAAQTCGETGRCKPDCRSCQDHSTEKRNIPEEWSPAQDPSRQEESAAALSAFASLPSLISLRAWAGQAGPSRGPPKCRLRLIQISDVYILDNMAALRTLIDTESKGFPPENVIKLLPGDFLAPSLLSSLDAGFAMVKVLNHVPIDMVCFGNHDGNDIAPAKLVHRIQEFKGTWLNSNMPSFEPKLPEHEIRSLTGEDGQKGARKVGFLGFCIGGGKFSLMYREEAFNSAHKSIVPVLEAVPGAVQKCRAEHPDVAEIIPLTHQDIAEDIEMAKMSIFPVIAGGHDHEQMLETHGENGCRIVKPGMDAHHAAIIDLVWYSLEPDAKPDVSVSFKAVKDYEPDPMMVDMCDKAQRPVRELESATLIELQGDQKLSSVNARLGDVSMARMLATSVRQCLNCDAVVINSGTVRGNKEYSDTISYGDLKKECPFESAMIVVMMPFSTLRDGIAWSRRPWREAEEGIRPKKEHASALQVDEGMIIVNHQPTTVLGQPPEDDPEYLYGVAIDVYVLRKNDIFRAYRDANPDRIPPMDSGRPLLPILIEHFCMGMWRQLIEGASSQVMSQASVVNFKRSARHCSKVGMDMTTSEATAFDKGARKVFQLLDENNDGQIDVHELQAKVRMILGDQLSSRIVVEQLMQLADDNADGILSEDELQMAIRKVAPGI